ncbi:hypothetical protein BD626DRAFT_547122 [Schizophyllum amplum]|uniref:Protein CPL1-like domain-containing protein n=1 Tax=Schizophyllum amplum TaxID=97359 RepID=A0A550CIT6_9AGAR|nr:hypothetical protein BD626DRAFT_547122 [Auriculariopsis ampla]
MLPSCSLVVLAVLLVHTAAAARIDRDVISSRQFRYKRAPVAAQTCLAINVPVDDTTYTDCICADVGVESAFLDRAPTDVLAALGVVDEADVDALITNQGTACTYPDNSTPVCSPSNACAFTCPDGVTTNADGTSCNVCTDPDLAFNPTTLVCDACAAPLVTCNGQCLPEGSTCASPAPGSRRRGISLRKRTMTPSCGEEQELCGINGVRWGSECVNTHSDVESCGGCMIPNPLVLQGRRRSFEQGADCTLVANADQVACEEGACRILSCKVGYTQSAGFCISV